MTLPFSFGFDVPHFAACAAVWAANIVISVLALLQRRAPRMRQVSPAMTSLAHSGALLWWLDLELSSQLNDLWRTFDGCWVWSLSVRSLCYTIFVGSLLIKQHLACVRWLTDDEGGKMRSLYLLCVYVLLPCVVLIIVVVVMHAVLNGESDCDPPRGFVIGWEVYQAVLMCVFCGVVVQLYRAIYHHTDETTRRSIRYVHPKLSDGVAEAVCLALLVAVQLSLHDGGVVDGSSESAARARATVVSVVIPTLMLWSVFVPPLVRTLREREREKETQHSTNTPLCAGIGCAAR
eukprot:TRINITY_DN2971_c0_g2_i1.p1 TRINITY_DN2971_c0_g2~~TRINITY_DN2971_c0_g2_i1.p1  ORF type:complete len:291 (+),score=59.10 TRINITY_DN2971_c0_g2_i1:234-1106(+)